MEGTNFRSSLRDSRSSPSKQCQRKLMVLPSWTPYEPKNKWSSIGHSLKKSCRPEKAELRPKLAQISRFNVRTSQF